MAPPYGVVPGRRSRRGDYSPIVSLSRRCSRTACGGSAIATLTYVYSDQTAVLGPLATYAEPHTYDLCAAHAERLTAPRGWDVVRLASEFVDPGPTQDDLLALADAVREAAGPARGSGRRPPPPPSPARSRWAAAVTCGSCATAEPRAPAGLRPLRPLGSSP